jgi:type I restriction enzyme S subunit
VIENLKPYPDYQATGMNWLGRAPAHWQVRRLKTLLREVDHRSSTGDQVLFSMTRRRGLIPQAEASDKAPSAASLIGYKICHAGDIVMNRMQAWSGMFHVAPGEGLVSPDYAVFASTNNANPIFLGHLLRSPAMVSKFHAESKGIGSGFLRLYTDRFGAIHTMLPPREEQDAIVRFLAEMDRRINRLIRNKRRLIELLNEQKQAIITQAVTRGLDPSVPMKPSGIDWLGSIPAHWEVLAVKRVLRRLIDCEHKTAPQVDDSEFIVVRTSAVRNGALRLKGTYRTTAGAFRQWTQRGTPEAGDVIFTREAPAGEACVVPDDLAVCLGQRTVLMKLRRHEYDSGFLVHMIYAGPPRDRIRLASQGSTVGHFNMDDIGWMPVLKPPPEEQESIVAAIGDRTRDADLALARAESEIALLGELRTRLIADVVTGELDVRAAAADLPGDDEVAPEPLHNAGEGLEDAVDEEIGP